MWYLFRAGPNDREGSYVSSFPSLDAVRRVVEDIAGESGKKLVIRQSESGMQFVIKDQATTFESLAGATVYAASQEKRNPVMKQPEFRMGGKTIKPGDRVPPRYLKYLKVDPWKGAK